MPPHLPSHIGPKLTDNQVRKIRLLYAEHELTYKALGQRFGVGWEHIRDIVTRKAWSHVK